MAVIPMARRNPLVTVENLAWFGLIFVMVFLCLTVYKQNNHINDLQRKMCGIRAVYEDGSVVPETNDAVRFACMEAHS